MYMAPIRVHAIFFVSALFADITTEKAIEIRINIFARKIENQPQAFFIDVAMEKKAPKCKKSDDFYISMFKGPSPASWPKMTNLKEAR